MSTAENVAVVRQMVEQGMGGGDPAAIGAAYAPDFVYHNPVMDEMAALPRGPDGMVALIGATRSAFPDLRYTIEAQVADEESVAVFYAWTGTQQGPLAGIPPTGTSVHATGAIFCRLRDGRIVEQWDVDDRLSVMQQLGMVPAPSRAR